MGIYIDGSRKQNNRIGGSAKSWFLAVLLVGVFVVGIVGRHESLFAGNVSAQEFGRPRGSVRVAVNDGAGQFKLLRAVAIGAGKANCGGCPLIAMVLPGNANHSFHALATLQRLTQYGNFFFAAVISEEFLSSKLMPHAYVDLLNRGLRATGIDNIELEKYRLMLSEVFRQFMPKHHLSHDQFRSVVSDRLPVRQAVLLFGVLQRGDSSIGGASGLPPSYSETDHAEKRQNSSSPSRMRLALLRFQIQILVALTVPCAILGSWGFDQAIYNGNSRRRRWLSGLLGVICTAIPCSFIFYLM